jgi:FkbM family methyltransferase
MTQDAPFGAHALSSFAALRLAWAQKMPVNYFGRRLALLLRKTVLAGGPAVIDAEVDGLKMRLHMRDNVSERKFLFMPQFFDRAERDLLAQDLRSGDVFVDIGANAGIYTLTAARHVGTAGRVIAIEPNPRMMARLRANVSLNDFAGRVFFENSAVSDVAGQFDMVLDESNLGGSSLVLSRSAQTIKVPCDTLMNILIRHGVTALAGLKIDIEGAEDKALVPFLKSAPASLLPRFMIIENSEKDWGLDLLGTLSAAGYRLERSTRMNMVWRYSKK